MTWKYSNMLLVFNAAYLLLFCASFVAESERYNKAAFEVDLARPLYVIANRAVSPYQEHQGVDFVSFRILQAPAIWIVRPVVWALNKHPDLWETSFWGTSPGGYLLIAQVVLSFAQWYLIGVLCARVANRFRGNTGITHSPPEGA
jgi:hypothetical protein